MTDEQYAALNAKIDSLTTTVTVAFKNVQERLSNLETVYVALDAGVIGLAAQVQTMRTDLDTALDEIARHRREDH